MVIGKCRSKLDGSKFAHMSFIVNWVHEKQCILNNTFTIKNFLDAVQVVKSPQRIRN